MEQSLIIAARTFEVSDEDHLIEDLGLLAGKAAGVCYMPDDYLEKGIQDTQKARLRAEHTARSGHHSVFDHGHITFVIHTNKMMAMLLNSINVYNTSEKSARYTIMQPGTSLEADLYEGWRQRLSQLILSKYPNIPPKEVSKLATENARYFLSVFTPTIMEYTISFRKVYLLRDGLVDLAKACESLPDPFHQTLKQCAEELARLFDERFPDCGIHDSKNQHLRFSEYPYHSTATSFKKEVLGDSYTLVYTASFAALAQLQRHRTLRYTMYFNGDSTAMGYYVPPIVADAGLSGQWLLDMESVAHVIPQGSLVRVTEQGIFEDFALKCKERLCGRVQLETMLCTADALNKFLLEEELLWEGNRRLLHTMTVDTPASRQPCARCMFPDFVCTESCRWGSQEALTRMI